MSITKIIPLALFVLICKQMNVVDYIIHCKIYKKDYCADIKAEDTTIAYVCPVENPINESKDVLDKYEPYDGRCAPFVLKIELLPFDAIVGTLDKDNFDIKVEERQIAEISGSSQFKYKLTILENHESNVKKIIDNLLIPKRRIGILNKLNKRIVAVLEENKVPVSLYIRSIYYLENREIKFDELTDNKKDFDKLNYLRTVLCLLEKKCDDSILKEKDIDYLLKEIGAIRKLEKKGIVFENLKNFIDSSKEINVEIFKKIMYSKKNNNNKITLNKV